MPLLYRVAINEYRARLRKPKADVLAILREAVGCVVFKEQPEKIRAMARRGAMRTLPYAEGPCIVCGKAAATQRHHIIPISRGGRNKANNIIGVCSACHRAIHANRTR